MSPVVETTLVAAIIVACAIYLLRSTVRSARRLFGGNGRAGACGGGCGGGCSAPAGAEDGSRRLVAIEKIPKQ